MAEAEPKNYQKLAKHIEAIANTLQESLLILSADLKVIFANKAFYKTFRVSMEETENREICSLGNGQWNIPKLQTLLNNILLSRGGYIH